MRVVIDAMGICEATGVGLRTVQRDIAAGVFDSGDMVSVCGYVRWLSETRDRKRRRSASTEESETRVHGIAGVA